MWAWRHDPMQKLAQAFDSAGVTGICGFTEAKRYPFQASFNDDPGANIPLPALLQCGRTIQEETRNRVT